MKLTLAIIITVLTFNSFGRDLETFLFALRKVESGGNVMAIGDSGKAIGVYQIHESYFNDAKDYNDKNKNKFGLAGKQYKDCFDSNIAKQVVLAYLQRYSKDDVKNGNWEILARKHNGGPNGHKNSSTIKYWQKINKEM